MSTEAISNMEFIHSKKLIGCYSDEIYQTQVSTVLELKMQLKVLDTESVEAVN